MDIWLLAALWFLMALVADFFSFKLKIAVALCEIVVALLVAYLIGLWMPEYASLGSDTPWVEAMASFGAVMLIFLAGTELNPESLKGQMKEIMLIGLAGFFIPFL